MATCKGFNAETNILDALVCEGSCSEMSICPTYAEYLEALQQMSNEDLKELGVWVETHTGICGPLEDGNANSVLSTIACRTCAPVSENIFAITAKDMKTALSLAYLYGIKRRSEQTTIGGRVA